MLETERLVLREMNREDAEDIYRIWSNPKVNKYLWDPLYTNVEDVRDVIPATSSSSDYAFAVIEKDTGIIIGTCGIGEEGKEDEWGFGYCLEPAAWGKGYATELLHALINLAQDKGIETLVGEVAIENPQSIRVMEKNGLKFHCNSNFTKSDGSETFKSKIYKKTL